MEIGKSLHTDVLYTETGVVLVGKMESLVIVYNQFIDLVFFCLLLHWQWHCSYALPQLQLNLKQMHSPNFAAETVSQWTVGQSKWLRLLNESGRY